MDEINTFFILVRDLTVRLKNSKWNIHNQNKKLHKTYYFENHLNINVPPCYNAESTLGIAVSTL